jgi:hypothetical protein
MIRVLKFFFIVCVLTENAESQNSPGVCTCVPIGACVFTPGGDFQTNKFKLRALKFILQEQPTMEVETLTSEFKQ